MQCDKGDADNCDDQDNCVQEGEQGEEEEPEEDPVVQPDRAEAGGWEMSGDEAQPDDTATKGKTTGGGAKKGGRLCSCIICKKSSKDLLLVASMLGGPRDPGFRHKLGILCICYGFESALVDTLPMRVVLRRLSWQQASHSGELSPFPAPDRHALLLLLLLHAPVAKG